MLCCYSNSSAEVSLRQSSSLRKRKDNLRKPPQTWGQFLLFPFPIKCISSLVRDDYLRVSRKQRLNSSSSSQQRLWVFGLLVSFWVLKECWFFLQSPYFFFSPGKYLFLLLEIQQKFQLFGSLFWGMAEVEWTTDKLKWLHLASSQTWDNSLGTYSLSPFSLLYMSYKYRYEHPQITSIKQPLIFIKSLSLNFIKSKLWHSMISLSFLNSSLFLLPAAHRFRQFKEYIPKSKHRIAAQFSSDHTVISVKHSMYDKGGEQANK